MFIGAMLSLYGSIPFTIWKDLLYCLNVITYLEKGTAVWLRNHCMYVKQLSLNEVCKIGLMTTSTLVSSW
jgi:hypothetical protein